MKKFGLALIVAVAAFLAPAAQAAPAYADVNETIGVGNKINVGLNPSPTGSWRITSISNQAVAQVELFTDSVTITGTAAGSSQVVLCANGAGDCMNINVTISGVLGAFTSLGRAHAPGTWVKMGKTVFYIHKNGVIPVPTYSIFLNNKGHKAKLEIISPADQQLPLLSLMTRKDARLK